MSVKVKEFIGKDGEQQIVQAIKAAELDTSGEIRVHIEGRCNADPLQRAVYIFNYLKMFRTKARNGVLVYVAVESRKFAIIGDAGINRVVPENFWDGIKVRMGEAFSRGEYPGGIAEAVRSAGEQLKKYFPYTSDDVNEQPDEISYGK